MKLESISQGSTVFCQFRKGFKGPSFYSGEFPQQKNLQNT